MEQNIEYWKDLAQRRQRTINSLTNQVEDLEGELSEANETIDDYQTDLRHLRELVSEGNDRFNSKTELLKQIGRLS